MLFGSSEVPQKIEFISYSPEYREQTLDVIKNSFFKFETVSVASEINTNPAGQDDLIKLCEDALQRSNVSIIARDLEKNLIVGAALNVIQVSLIYIFDFSQKKHTYHVFYFTSRSKNPATMARATSNIFAIMYAKLRMPKV